MRHHFIFGLFSLFSLAQVHGEELTLNTQVAERGYSKFCTTDAKKIIDSLNEKSAEKVKPIAQITAQIDSLNARKTIINNLVKIKDQYLESLGKFAETEKVDINNFKSLLKGSLTLSAVQMLVKSDPDLKAANVKELCKISENKSTPICLHLDDIYHWGKLSEVTTLDQTLANFKMTYDLTEKEKMKKDVEVIYHSINDSIKPEVILKTMLTSKNFIPALAQGDREAINNCLQDLADGCKKLMNHAPADREKFSQILSSEMKGMRQEINKTLLNDFFSQYGTKDSSEKSFNKLISAELKKADATLAVKSELTQDLDKYCKEESENYSAKECQKTNMALVADLNNQEKSDQLELKKLNDQLSEKLNKNGSLETIEKLKKYVGDKYLRSCSSPDTLSVTSNINCLSCLAKTGASDTNSSSSSGSIGLLGEKMSSIVGQLKVSNTLSDKKGELGIYSKAELNSYSQLCRNSSIAGDPTAALVCADINKESSKIVKVKETKDWEDFNKKYWVEYSPTSKTGYSAYEKKTNARIFGEAFSQSISRIYPAWISNYMLTNQINYMGNQAIYMKQINYMNSFDSPWMNLPYFQGNYFNASTYSAAGTVNATNSFNFAK
jgi:hypothetical protein